MAYCYVRSGNGGGVNVRAAKNTTSSRLGTIPDEARVNIVTCDDTWATLTYNGTPAFVQHRYISNPPNEYGLGLGEGAAAKCNTDNVNVRSGPGTNYGTNGSQLDKSDSVTAYEYGFDGSYVWYRIGTNRWVRGDYLAPADGYVSSGDGGSSGRPTNKYEMYGPSTQVLRVGSYGVAVINLQRTLVASGDLASGGENSPNVDGAFGTRTETAVKQFQLENGLNPDGVVGEDTKAYLWILYGSEIAYQCNKVS